MRPCRQIRPWIRCASLFLKVASVMAITCFEVSGMAPFPGGATQQLFGFDYSKRRDLFWLLLLHAWQYRRLSQHGGTGQGSQGSFGGGWYDAGCSCAAGRCHGGRPGAGHCCSCGALLARSCRSCCIPLFAVYSDTHRPAFDPPAGLELCCIMALRVCVCVYYAIMGSCCA